MSKVKRLLVTIEQQGFDSIPEATIAQMLDFAKNNPKSCGFYDDVKVLSVELIDSQEL